MHVRMRFIYLRTACRDRDESTADCWCSTGGRPRILLWWFQELSREEREQACLEVTVV